MKFACKWRQLFLLCTLTARIAMAAFTLSSLTDIASTGFGLMTQSIDWAATKIGYEACPYVEDPFPAITHGITNYILGQESAVTLILNITAGWEMNRRSEGDQEPLVLIFTGDTGTN
jgi:hypothetical protein